MADDGMLMNFEIGDAPIVPKVSFQGGRWRDRLIAKKGALRRANVGAKKAHPSERALFNTSTHEVGEEEYIGSGAERLVKRQRVEDVNRTPVVPRKERKVAEQEETRPAFVAGKLPPGSISIGGRKSTKFQDDPRPTFAAGNLPARSMKTGGRGSTKFYEDTRSTFVTGKLPSGSITIGSRQSTKFQDNGRPVYVPGKALAGDIPGGHREGGIGGKPGQVISSLFSFNPTSKTKLEEPVEKLEPANPSNAPLTPEMANFTTLGLSTRLAAHLATKLDMKAPTAIQKAAIPEMIKGDDDAFIQAETGSGKTLAYLLPIIERLLAMSSKDVQVHRNSGLFGVVLAPTRELCKQIATVAERVLRCAPWIVATTVIGGESKQSEKARLRKGVNILIATPGRLADHLDNTEVLNVSTVRWLVLDEGDRLMELGFEEEIKGIVEKIGRRSLTVGRLNGLDSESLPKRRVTVLCSATMKLNVQRLGEISLKDAVHIQVDPTDGEAARAKADRTEGEAQKFSAPAQLKQAYAVVPAKLRLVTLKSILRRGFARRGSVMKTIIFISCADSVDFHFALFSRAEEVAEDETEERPELKRTDLTKDTIAHATAFSSKSNSVILHRLHGSLAQNIRTATLKAFTESSEPCVLICTDVASRGLDLPNVDYVIEYDPSFSGNDHLHRVGRTARAGKDGRALIFLLPGDEEEYVSVLASGYREGKKALTHHTAEDLLRKGFGGTGHEWEERATEWQLDIERWAQDSPKYLEMARRGYQSHIRAYATHVANERHIFNMQTLHLGHLAKAFALRDKPGSIKVPGLRPQKMTKADRSVAERKNKRGEVEDKAPEGERVRKQKKLELDLPSVGDDAARRMKKKMKEHMAVASEFNIG